MRIEIYGEEEKKAEEKVLRLRLEPSDYEKGSVALVAVDREGLRLPGGNLLFISEKGFERVNYVSRGIPLPLDGDGKVKIKP